MKRVSLFSYVLLFISFTEILDSTKFIINIPVFPLSLGRTCFVLNGLILIYVNRFLLLQSKILNSLIFIYSGIALSSLAIGSGLSELTGVLLLFTGAIGNAFMWSDFKARKFLNFFYLILYVYWLIISFSISDSLLFIDGEETWINHHVPGIMTSVTSIYIAIRFFYFKASNIYIIIFLLISLSSTIYIESRSNSLLIIFFLFYLLYLKGTNFKRIIKLIPLIFLIMAFLINFISSSEALTKRFTFSDAGYQKRTTEVRWEVLALGFENIFENYIFGSGVLANKVVYNQREINYHNQYFTFAAAGGVLSLFGVIYFLKNILISFFKLRNNKYNFLHL